MGQTLTHGVYLPAEGERNCYDGLASNWNILDGAVGTIAEHTTALAGKAPAVHTHTKSDVTDLLNSNFIPSANNSYDLGSSSYQWNNVYAKGYFYNGVAWGLDKANVWTRGQTYVTGHFGEMIWLKSSELDFSVNGNTGLTQTYQSMIHWVDNNNAVFSSIQSWTNSTENTLVLRSKYRTDASTVRELSVRFTSTATDKVIYPETNGDTDLGTSTNKWKSLNGINPGALSLPSATAENIDTTNWNFSWNANTVTAPFDGYISIACFGSALQINNETKSYAMTFAPGTDGFICGLLPVSSGDSIKVLVTRTQTSIYEGYKFIKSLGNVS